MGKDLEEQESVGFNLDHYLGIIRRRHFHFLAPMFLGWVVIWGMSWILPARYKSSTLILVEQPTMPKDYVTPNITDDLQERLQSITQQILSRTRLLRIIDDLGLYSDRHGINNSDDKVDRMRKDIEIDLVRDVQNRVTAFNVYYSARNSHTAQSVTRELTDLFINENLEVRQQASEDTTKFLESQLEGARETLAAQEEKIREFKGQHLQELPTQLSSNLQILAGLQSQLRTEEDALNSANQQHVYLETLLNQYRTLHGSASTSQRTQMGLPAIDQQLEKLKSDLADLTSRYTERHPDVRKLKDQISKTESKRDQLLASLKPNQAFSADLSTQPELSGDSISGQVSPLAQSQSQLQANDTEIRNREQSVAALKVKVNDYQVRLDKEPIREQQLADLTRGYDQSQSNYDGLLKKKNESAMATSMELLQQGERFRVLDPPSLPVKPDFPNRLRFCGIGIVAGLALGAGVVAGCEMMDDHLYTEQEIRELVPVPVISEIPAIVNPADEDSAKRKNWLAWATVTFMLVAILAGSAVSYLRG